MNLKVSKRTIKSKFSFPLYLIVYAVASLIGFIEGGLPGLAIGLCSALLCSLITLVGIIPFVGIPIYIILADKINTALSSLGPFKYTLVSQIFSKIAFGFFVVIVNLFVSFIVLVVLLALLFGRKK